MLQQDIDPQETREWLEALDAVVEHDGPDRAQHLLERVVGHAQLTGAAPAPAGTTPYINTIPPQRRARVPGRRGARAARALAHPLERDRDGAQGQQGVLRARRPHRQLPVGGDALRGRLQPLLARARPTSHGGDLVYMQGHSSPGIYARAFLEGRLTEEQLRRLPPGGLAQRAAVVPAPVADAGLLAVPDRLDGARADHGDLPGPLHEVPRRAARSPTPPAARSGPSWATARPTSPSRWARSRWPAASSSTT